jgi:hypothetical protein
MDRTSTSFGRTIYNNSVAGHGCTDHTPLVQPLAATVPAVQAAHGRYDPMTDSANTRGDSLVRFCKLTLQHYNPVYALRTPFREQL